LVPNIHVNLDLTLYISRAVYVLYINTFHNQETAQQVPLVHIYRRHRQNVSPISYSHLHVSFVYHCSLKMAIRNSRNILVHSPIYVDKLHMFCSLLVIKLIYDFRSFH
jgi:hypothetical protein